jgi:uncharacterized membrane protein YhaH (DUF805 family)
VLRAAHTATTHFIAELKRSAKIFQSAKSKHKTNMQHYLTVIKKYAVFSGRARRSEYWMFILFNFIVGLILAFIGGFIGDKGMFSNLYQLAVLIPSIAVGVRRMHDTNHSGWWLLLPIVNLIFAVRDSDSGENRFGLSPKPVST